MDILKHYVDMFNRDDNELYKNDVHNAHAYEWLKEEIPIFACPDKELERTYYFRFWTYRKHIKTTEEGYVITEFLPNVPWAGQYNTINAPFGFHLSEGRWLKNSDKYISDYINFFLNHPESSHSYSTWLCYAVMDFLSVTGDVDFARKTLPKLCEYYKAWEDSNMLENGMFFSVDGRDAMEYSISGRNNDLKRTYGIRPTLNSYICADAAAISQIAAWVGEPEIQKEYYEKHQILRRLINNNLYKDGFYRAFHHIEKEKLNRIFEDIESIPPRELIGYIPWMFNIPTQGQCGNFELLSSKDSFYTEYGPATAERSHPRFLYEAEHNCLWNGYVWPFATSQTLYALQNAIDNYGYEGYKDLYLDMLIQYAKIHTRTIENGRKICWIDESRHPFRDEWYTRARIENKSANGILERGKDYNHSSFCDHIITGIVGVKPTLDFGLVVNPNIPADWEYFTLSNLHYKGKCYDISYHNKTGMKITSK